MPELHGTSQVKTPKSSLCYLLGWGFRRVRRTLLGSLWPWSTLQKGPTEKETPSCKKGFTEVLLQRQAQAVPPSYLELTVK